MKDEEVDDAEQREDSLHEDFGLTKEQVVKVGDEHTGVIGFVHATV